MSYRELTYWRPVCDDCGLEYGAEIVVANREDMSPQQEMVEDLMAIVHTYSCRLHGLRRYKKASDLIGKDNM